MKQIKFMDKYPVFSYEIKKDNIRFSNANEIANYFKASIEAHPVAVNLGTFDNFAHTKKLNGEIEEGMRAALIVTFCFGKAIPKNHILAARPRAFGISEYDDKFVIDFLEAPNDEIQQAMEKMIKGLQK